MTGVDMLCDEVSAAYRLVWPILLDAVHYVRLVRAESTNNTITPGPATLCCRCFTSLSNTNHEGANCVTLSLSDLEQRLLFCGIKRHRLHRVLRRLLSQLLLCCYPSAAVSTSESNDSATTSHLGLQAPSSCPPHTSHDISTLLVHIATYGECGVMLIESVFEQLLVRLLCSELRGQMITLHPLARWRMVQRVQVRQTPLILLCGGTSGSGKSTLASLLASQLGIARVVSTDTLRQLLRSRASVTTQPELFCSTYELLPSLHSSSHISHCSPDACTTVCSDESVDETTMFVRYEQQCQRVLELLDGVIARSVARGQSLVVEGVHLLPQYMSRTRDALFAQKVACLPVLLRINKPDCHRERFRTRARCMSVQPSENKYIAAFDQIRLLQDYLARQAATSAVFCRNNSNVDKTCMVLHRAVLQMLEMIELKGWSAAAASQRRTSALAECGPKTTLQSLQARHARHCHHDDMNSVSLDLCEAGLRPAGEASTRAQNINMISYEEGDVTGAALTRGRHVTTSSSCVRVSSAAVAARVLARARSAEQVVNNVRQQLLVRHGLTPMASLCRKRRQSGGNAATYAEEEEYEAAAAAGGGEEDLASLAASQNSGHSCHVVQI